MRRQVWFCVALAAILAICCGNSDSAWAQLGGIGGGGLGGGGLGGGGLGGVGGGGGGGGGQAGILVDPDGVLKRIEKDPSGRLTQQRLLAARANPGLKQAKRSPLRKIALKRLEAAAQQLLANKQNSDEIFYLAGMTRLTHVFYLPEIDDIVIAGPAEPYFIDAEDVVRGMDSMRPCLRLEDLIVALRAFGPGKQGPHMIGCSIDPTQEGLNRLQQFLKNVGGRATPNQTRALVQGLRKSLGMQTVSVQGISAKTRLAQVMVSADYRMKLIGIGLERPAVKIQSYVDFARPSSQQNALVRWYFTPNYQAVRVAEDGLAMELVGEGVKLVGADELVNADGTRNEVGQASGASKKFVDGFTRQYAELADREPVYAELRNMIDIVIAAAYIQQEDYYGKASWTMSVLGDERQLQTEVYNTPKQVESAVNAVWKGRRLMTPIGGGVNIMPYVALKSENMLADDDGLLKATRDKINVGQLPPERWWWD